jgi:hypothetical protein
MKITVTINEIINFFREKYHAENDDDFYVEIVPEPISSVETFGITPWEKTAFDDEEIYRGLDEDVREAVGFKTYHSVDWFNVVQEFIKGVISWDIFSRFTKYLISCGHRSSCTYLYSTIIAVEIDHEPVSLATAARYLQCSDTYIRNLLKKGTLEYIQNTKTIVADKLIAIRGGMYINGVLNNVDKSIL